MAVKMKVIETKEYDVEAEEETLESIEVTRSAGNPAAFREAAIALIGDKLGLTYFEVCEKAIYYATETTIKAQSIET